MFSMLDVCKSDGRRDKRVQTLRDVSLTVAAGEIVGIVEQHTREATTLLNVAAGHITPDTGQMRLGDFDLVGLRRRKRRAIYSRHVLLVNGRLPPRDACWTVYKHVYFSLLVAGKTSREAAGMTVDGLERRRVSELASTPLEELRFWDRVDVEIARMITTRKRFVVVHDLFDRLGTSQAQRARMLLRSAVNEVGCGCS